MFNLHSRPSDSCSVDHAMVQHLDELVAELRDRSVTPSPLNLLHYALNYGLSEADAANIAEMLERRLQGARQ
jgi:hypothetical protein